MNIVVYLVVVIFPSYLFFFFFWITQIAISVVIPCAIWYNFYNLKNVKKHPSRSDAFTKSNTFSWVFKFLKLYRWFQIAQSVTINVSVIYFKVSKKILYFLTYIVD